MPSLEWSRELSAGAATRNHLQIRRDLIVSATPIVVVIPAKYAEEAGE